MEGYGLRIGHQDMRISSCHNNILYIYNSVTPCRDSRYFEDIVKLWIYRLRTNYNFLQVCEMLLFSTCYLLLQFLASHYLLLLFATCYCLLLPAICYTTCHPILAMFYFLLATFPTLTTASTWVKICINFVFSDHQPTHLFLSLSFSFSLSVVRWGKVW